MVNGSTVDVVGLCGAWYVPVAGTRYVNTGLKLTSGVFISFDDMRGFEVIRVDPPEAATNDYPSPELVEVRIGVQNGATVTGELDQSAQQWSIAGPSTVAGTFETPIHQVLRVDFV
jgi:hypothetical protein